MAEFSTPLEERQRLSRIHRKRYWSCPEYRLRKINRSRVGLGLQPYQSVEQIKTKGPLWEVPE
jgi:hypothetical protein